MDDITKPAVAASIDLDLMKEREDGLDIAGCPSVRHGDQVTGRVDVLGDVPMLQFDEYILFGHKPAAIQTEAK